VSGSVVVVVATDVDVPLAPVVMGDVVVDLTVVRGTVGFSVVVWPRVVDDGLVACAVVLVEAAVVGGAVVLVVAAVAVGGTGTVVAGRGVDVKGTVVVVGSVLVVTGTVVVGRGVDVAGTVVVGSVVVSSVVVTSIRVVVGATGATRSASCEPVDRSASNEPAMKK
jgi:hypothetical protein